MFFNQQEIGEILNRKADIELIKRIQNVKADREELHRLDETLTYIDHKVQHLSVLQSELAK